MLAQEVIYAKREGNSLTKEQIEFIITGMIDSTVTESQISALTMAIFFQGMNRDECVALTASLQNSGSTLNWNELDINGPIVDKHSTGGVGDKVSIMLAPMLAACGAFVPMISGRGLGHTGGTLDKMESIPGYNTTPAIEDFQSIVSKIGCAIVGQTPQLAPADKQLYGIRDVTATVESIPLITASILSKKLSAGLDSLVMDVKMGSGSFNSDINVAKKLAQNLVEVGDGFGLPITALITDMSQVLGQTAGNALEIKETLEYLTGEYRDPRLHEITVELGAELLILSGLSENIEQARMKLNNSLTSGSATEYFGRMVTELGGPSDFLENSNKYLKTAAIELPVYAKVEDGKKIAAIDGRAIGNAVVALGGGRKRAQDTVDHSVGLSAIKGIGDTVSRNDPLLFIHANNRADADAAELRIHQAISYSNTAQSDTSAIIEKVSIKNN